MIPLEKYLMDRPVGFHPLMIMVILLVISVSVFFLTGPNYLLALAPGPALLVLLLLWNRPELGLFMILFLLPLDQYTGLSVAYKSVTVSKLIGLLTVLLFGIRLLSDRSNTYHLGSGLWSWLLAFFGIWLLGTLASQYPATSINALRRLLTAYSIFFLGLGLLSRDRLFKVLPLVIIISTTLSALISIYGAIANDPAFIMNVNKKYLRYAGGVSDPNDFATMQLFALPLIACTLRRFKGTRGYWPTAGLLGVCVVSVILTYSRAGALIMSATLLLLGGQYLREFNVKKTGFFLLSFALAGLIILTVIPDTYWQRQTTLTQHKTDFSIGRRLSYLIFAFEKFKDKPLFGYGPATFEKMYATSQWSLHFAQEDRAKGRVAHNSYVEVLIGTGLIGLTLYLVIIIYAYKNFYAAWGIYHHLNLTEKCRQITAFAISFSVLLMSFMFLSINYHKYFWISLAISQVGLKYAKNDQKQLEDTQG